MQQYPITVIGMLWWHTVVGICVRLQPTNTSFCVTIPQTCKQTKSQEHLMLSQPISCKHFVFVHA